MPVDQPPRTAPEAFTGPIIIVGASRSGTTLLQEVLNRHSDVEITGETHYFDDLRPRLDNGRSKLTADQAQACRLYFASLTRTYGAAKLIGATEGQQAPLTARTGDEAFAEHCIGWAAARGKRIWGEKTPRHLFRVREILAAFPQARVVVLVRDPRGAVASYRDWRTRWISDHPEDLALVDASAAEDARIRASYSLTTITLLWRSAAREALALADQYGSRSLRVLRYEDLVTETETTLRALCEWLGIPFQARMLEVPVVNSSYETARAPEHGLDASVAYRWRRALSADEIGYIEALAGNVARTFDYPPTGHRCSAAFMVREAFWAPFALTRAVLANRHRIGALVPFVVSRIRRLA